MHLNATYDITAPELLRANRWALRRRHRSLWLLAFCVLAEGALQFSSGQQEVGGLFVAFAVALAFWMTLGIHASAKRRLAQLTGPFEVTLSEPAVVISRPGLRIEAAWATFARIEETPEFLLLVQTGMVHWVILKRAFSSAEQQELTTFLATLPNLAASTSPVRTTV